MHLNVDLPPSSQIFDKNHAIWSVKNFHTFNLFFSVAKATLEVQMSVRSFISLSVCQSVLKTPKKHKINHLTYSTSTTPLTTSKHHNTTQHNITTQHRNTTSPHKITSWHHHTTSQPSSSSSSISSFTWATFKLFSLFFGFWPKPSPP